MKKILAGNCDNYTRMLQWIHPKWLINCVVQFWSGNIPVILNRTRAARSEDFKITPMISDQIALHSVQLTLCKSV